MIQEFLAEVVAVYKTGIAREHAYRPALQKLFNALSEDTTAVNEPARVDVGAPDFVFLRGDLPIGHCEAKDIGHDVKTMKGYSREQKQRYRDGFQNLIYTNCLDWRFYREGEFIAQVTIADFLMGIQPRPDDFDKLETLLRDFITQTPQTITSSKRLAERMAGKAKLIKDVLGKSLVKDTEANNVTELVGQYNAFKEHLIHDISLSDFADIYAETIAYGMFAARLHDETLEDFSRQEALELLPKSNPFLRKLFGYIAGPDLDERLIWIIEDLAKVFQATDVAKIMERFGNTTQRNDPFLHFYEDFLAAYNPKKREVRGVWYTPEPVVDFIIRAVDDVLKTEFGITDGLADNSKITIDWDTGQTDQKGRAITTKKDVHRVQILDPAAGTGTFLAQAVKHIAPRIQATAPGMWAGYVEKDLIPRLHGFELLMASYAMCHMKLEMVLRDYGYQPTTNPPRVSVYLTNSLEEGEAANQSLPFAQWLSNEVKEANTIKRDQPIMCVIGNPPYSGVSQNRGQWIEDLIAPYKMEPGGAQKLQERKHWLNDDYVKFIRMSESLIEKNGEGVLGFITNHGYLDNPTFRGMRWHLLKTFDKIYVLDLHGNSNKKEVSPDGKPDKNVFDIKQGVAIIIGVKTKPTVKGDKRKKGEDIPLAKVFHGELWGDRKGKYQALWENKLEAIACQEVSFNDNRYFFEKNSFDGIDKYKAGFSVNELWRVKGLGFQSSRDDLVVALDKKSLEQKLRRFCDLSLPDEKIRSFFFGGRKEGKYKRGDTRQWALHEARRKMHNTDWSHDIQPCLYRPFDERPVLYRSDMIDWPRPKVLNNMLQKNLALIANRQTKESFGILLSDKLTERKIAAVYDASTTFPLYLYPAEDELDQTRRVNFDDKLYKKLRKLAKHETRGEADEVAVFDYIYGVLHCPAYRETYAEFLKIDFPRIPWPASPDVFWNVSDKGGELRALHLMEEAAIGEAPFPFTGEGDNTVAPKYPKYVAGAGGMGEVYINETQRFIGAPEISWNFYIGGYQPAQKWLKDRRGRELSFDDVRHYQKILKILSETDRIMKTIDMPLEGSDG